MIKGCRIALVAVVALPLVTSCQTNEQTGALLGTGLGAGLGAGIGAAVSHGSTTGILIGAALGGLGGYFAGSAIGRMLDQRDQQIAEQATQVALNDPAPVNTSGPGYYPPAANYPEAAPEEQTPQQAQQKPRRPHRVHQWKSDHSGATGSSEVVAVQRTSTGAECKTVHEVAYEQGQKAVQDSKYCRSADGSWAAAAA